MNKSALAFLRKAWHAHALFWGRDETQTSAHRNCVVLAPHPDDESIGMGATIAQKTATGTSVALVVATDGRYSQDASLIHPDELISLRKTELHNAAHQLGISEENIFFVDEEDTKINDDRLRARFEEILDSLNFNVDEILSTSWNDSHHDHQACAKIAHDVAHDRGLIFRGCPIYWWAEGPTRFHRGEYSSTKKFLGRFLDVKRAFLSRGYTVSSGKFAVNRTRAINEYQSQITQRNEDKKWSTLDKKWLATFDRRREFFIEQ